MPIDFHKHARSVLLVVLLVASLALLWASYNQMRSCPWLSDLLLNLGAGTAIFIPAIFFVEWLIARHEESRWKAVDQHVGFYAKRVANGIAYAYRVAEGIGDESLPHEQLKHDRVRGMMDWIRGTILPGVSQIEQLTPAGWTELAENLAQPDREAHEALLLYGNRLSPDLFRRLIEVRRSIYLAQISIRDYSPVLGVPNALVAILPTARIYDYVEMAQTKHPDKSPEEVINGIRYAGLVNARECAEESLLAAIALLEATSPLPRPDDETIKSRST